jgi:hypothetical protein
MTLPDSVQFAVFVIVYFIILCGQVSNLKSNFPRLTILACSSTSACHFPFIDRPDIFKFRHLYICCIMTFLKE